MQCVSVTRDIEVLSRVENPNNRMADIRHHLDIGFCSQFLLIVIWQRLHKSGRRTDEWPFSSLGYKLVFIINL